MSRHHDRIKNDPRWKAVRLEVLERDGYQCTEPECTEETDLHIHHIIPISVDPSLALDAGNLRTLCAPHNLAIGDRVEIDPARVNWVNSRYDDVAVFIEAFTQGSTLR